jgi:F420-non-reducing hydrogenase large subunit
VPQQLTIDPVTRIEGHASVEIEMSDDRKISGAVFKVMDFRGFEAFLQGMNVEMMPTLTARICGTCPVTHHLASSRTVDKVFGATIPRAAELQRNIMNLGALISSHAVHFFALAGPDLILGLTADPAKRNIVGMVEKHPALSKGALKLRSIGTRIVEIVGGRGTHPVTSVPGGMAAPLGPEKIKKLQDLVAEGLELGQKLYTTAKSLLTSQEKLMQSLPLQTNYVGTVKDGALELYQGDFRVLKTEGSHFDFGEDEWTSYLTERAVDTSYGKQVFVNTGSDSEPYRVGPLARLNCAERIDTPLANAELEEFRQNFGSPCHETVLYHHARMIEILHALEKLDELVKDQELGGSQVQSELGTPGDATAHVEAPRGALIHDYKVDKNGVVTQANLLVATQQNLAAINATIGLSAQRYIEQPDDVLLNAVEFGIRCYDPCLSCATHRIGDMKLDVIIRHDGKIIRRARR